MDRNEIIQALRTIFITILKHENFEMRDELTANDVEGWDSLSHMLIISAIEDHFKIKFKLKELNKLKNLQSLVEVIQSKLTINT